MKELSIKEKAKAYDEALEKARQLCVYPTTKPFINDLQDLFPELKESEEEKARKRIIALVNAHGQGVYKGDMLAWIEKQGEIDKESYEIAEKEKREFVGDGFIKCYADFQDFKEGKTYWLEYLGNDDYNVRSDNLLGKTYHITPCQLYTIFKKLTWLEKQDKKKLPIEKLPSEMKTIEESLGFTTQKECDEYNQTVSDLIMSDDNFNDSGEKKVQAKSLWHEYYHPIDKDRLFLLISKDKRASIMSWSGESLKSVTFGGGGGIILEGDKFAYIDELQEIHKHADWSEEDKRMFDYALDMIEWYGGKNEKRVRLVSDWLKSLKQRYTWKPNDEQLGELKKVVDTTNLDLDSNILWNLYQDLKKLREE